ncbi:Helicase c2 OS=Tsukamurella paurometabola (strain ATCC 8368 / DSM / CCUG 35730 / CIP 100753/ JCM 10117 / KCTC 9821 / NBRC 16120 / NCIMB 702349 / NCTC 13040)OX=521096 GN=Tpau_1280 PE=3 SV=1 [Tsukamurella paurometabola]|uniref:ATP-dependent helicase DinG n=1 Tax=Tsukamurella paurometabola (strain ATCC 8368 / DSM 20162 / CCUG 35730 / CIP 100753 / JCM 10117 / KCTC 9821 / NBRC 16120 / NCIMB 702349 / NCTC 13040) TaxID=521096 RepID=D5UWN8_TSUPD|nr:ATP-dependent DNA helicase [Tsukamurella paurometabola]ADG77910.1 helicase c2 [Tsukamurella paurometabola DSM 20162]SUP29318.1 Probable ATP-dependent helicase dinG homolog [Tsukamurella paurometabola]
MTEPPIVPKLLDTAVTALGGSKRDGQVRMAAAVAHSLDTGEHLAVQAGTGTGKSLAYLVPSIRHAVTTGKTVVVSTATIALQQQLVDRDLPRLSKALKKDLGREPEFAILKGRGNYLCLNKLHSSVASEPDSEELFDPFAASRLGREMKRIREWSSDTETGDRDELSPAVTDQSWRLVSVGARECLGATNCAYGQDCFAETARKRTGQVDVVVTNHALLAIDAMTEVNVLPDHDAVVVDEAHELVDRVTSVATAELTGATVAAAARRAGKLVEEEIADNLVAASEGLTALLEESGSRRWLGLPDGAGPALAAVRDAAWATRTAVGPARGANLDPDAAAARSAAITALDEVHDTAVRVLTAFDEPDEAKRRDVVWTSDVPVRGGGLRRTLHVAPLSVGGLLRSRLFGESTVVLTSATLAVGGAFDSVAGSWGLPRAGGGEPDRDPDLASGKKADATVEWSHLDVGSPFDYARSGILYVATKLPPPGRDGTNPVILDEIETLIKAAGGRTLGLFSSTRAAKAAAEALRERLDTPILCQGEGNTGQLVRDFAADPATSLFGTLSLWQGVDVPGPSLSLVLIDRIPFPRPDDPLLTARQRAVESRGGNGFMAVAATHAALLLAQGVGRLLRSTDDRGVVAVLDSRLATARYGGFLRATLPPFWETANRDTAVAALQRLAES